MIAVSAVQRTHSVRANRTAPATASTAPRSNRPCGQQDLACSSLRTWTIKHVEFRAAEYAIAHYAIARWILRTSPGIDHRDRADQRGTAIIGSCRRTDRLSSLHQVVPAACSRRPRPLLAWAARDCGRRERRQLPPRGRGGRSRGRFRRRRERSRYAFLKRDLVGESWPADRAQSRNRTDSRCGYPQREPVVVHGARRRRRPAATTIWMSWPRGSGCRSVNCVPAVFSCL